MQYNGGCLIGVEMLGGVSAPGTGAQNWPFSDGAWTPAADYYISASSYQITLPYISQGATNALLIDTAVPIHLRPDQSIPTNTYCLYVGGSANLTLQSISDGRGHALYITTDGAFETTTTNSRLFYQSSSSVSSHVQGAEISMAKIVEVPYNQELVSYRRTPSAPSSIEIKTMDGAVRRYVTGPASTTIAATWRWSDDGTIATQLGDILSLSKSYCYPLIVFAPAGIYYTGAALDLVIPANEPTVTMPAPGVYELTIEGTCQP